MTARLQRGMASEMQPLRLPLTVKLVLRISTPDQATQRLLVYRITPFTGSCVFSGGFCNGRLGASMRGYLKGKARLYAASGLGRQAVGTDT